jgi:hypothetical protein
VSSSTEKNKALVDTKGTKAVQKPESPVEPKKDGPGPQKPERGEQEKLSKEAESFLREIEERKQKERDRDPNRDPSKWDEYTR